MDSTTYAILDNKIEETASGISDIVPIANGLRFTTLSGEIIDVALPTHSHSNLNTILEKFTLDGSNNLLFNGQPIKGNTDLTPYLKIVDADIKYESKDSTIVKDVNYVHTDNNFSQAEKKKLATSMTGVSSYTVGVGGVLQYTIGYISNADTIMTASSNNTTHYNKVVGFIVETKAIGEQVKVQFQGELINTSWSLISSDSYYLGLGGNITNIAPTSGFIQKVGIAKNSTTLIINLCQPIKLI